MKKSNKIKNISIFILATVMLVSFCSCTKNGSNVKTVSFDEQRVLSSNDFSPYIGKENLKKISENKFYRFCIGEKTNSPVISSVDGKSIYSALSNDKNNGQCCFRLKALINDKIYLISSNDGVSSSSVVDNNKATVKYVFDIDNEKFEINVSYSLVLADFSVEVLLDDSNENVTILSIDVLPYFFSFKNASAGDFILVPDNSGAVMHLDKNDMATNEVVFDCYGTDLFVSDEERNVAKIASFGIKNGNNALCAVASVGDCYCHINAFRQTVDADENRAYFSFDITQNKIDTDKKTISVCNKNTDKVCVCYKLLADENATYASMANASREELIKLGYIPSENTSFSDKTQFMLNVVGENNKKVLSRFSQTGQIIDLLKGKGIGAFSLKYIGALGGGVQQRNLYNTSVSRKQGSLGDLNELNEYAVKSGVDLYLDLSVCSSSRSYVENFSAKNISSKKMTENFFDKMYFDYKKTDRLFNRVESEVSLRSTKNQNLSLYSNNEFYSQNLLDLNTLYSKLSLFANDKLYTTLDGIAINDASHLLYSSSDFNREESKNMMTERLKSLGNGKKICLENPNVFCVSLCDVVTDLNFETQFKQSDAYESVPFLPIVYHGSVSYCSKAIDYGDPLYKYEFLRALEYGSIPTYCFVFSDESIFYYGYYSDQEKMNEVVQSYKKSRQLYDGLENKRIVNHKKITKNSDGENIDGVYLTEYSNGTVIYVNYRTTTVTTEDNVVVSGLNAVRIDR